MAKLKKVTFQNKQEAYDWCNKLLAYFWDNQNPKPITVSYGFGEIRRLPQNAYYWLCLSKAVEYFEQNPLELIRFIEKSVDEKFLTTKFLHELCKMRYLKDDTTTDKDTAVFAKLTDSLRQDMLHDHNLLIEEPRQ